MLTRDAYRQQIAEAYEFISKKVKTQPQVGIILGTGLGGLAREIKTSLEIPYQTIPHFPVSTVESHEGKLIFGELGGKQVMAMQGRFHFYEGYTMQQITFPLRIMKKMGIGNEQRTNAHLFHDA